MHEDRIDFDVVADAGTKFGYIAKFRYPYQHLPMKVVSANAIPGIEALKGLKTLPQREHIKNNTLKIFVDVSNLKFNQGLRTQNCV